MQGVGEDLGRLEHRAHTGGAKGLRPQFPRALSEGGFQGASAELDRAPEHRPQPLGERLLKDGLQRGQGDDAAVLATAFRMAWWPFAWRTIEEPDHQRVFQRIHLSFSFLLLGLATMIGLLARPILRLVATSEYEAGAPVVGFLAVSMSLGLIGEIAGIGIFVTRKTYFTTVFSFAGAAINIGFLVVLVPSLKLVGVPLAALAGSAATLGLYWWTSERLYPIGFHVMEFLLFLLGACALLSIGIWVGLI